MRTFVSLAFALISSPLLAQDFDRAKIDSLFALIDAHQQGMGSISIFADGQEVYQRTFGYASVEEQIAADRGTVY